MTQLGRLCSDRLGVIARSSAMRVQRADRTAREIGTALRAHYLLEGTVRTEGDRVRITAQLIEARGETQLWAESYERPSRTACSSSPTSRRRSSVRSPWNCCPIGHRRRPPARAPRGTAGYLKGRYYWNRPGEEGLRECLAFYDGRCKLDPRFATATPRWPARPSRRPSTTCTSRATALAAAEAPPRGRWRSIPPSPRRSSRSPKSGGAATGTGTAPTRRSGGRCRSTPATKAPAGSTACCSAPRADDPGGGDDRHRAANSTRCACRQHQRRVGKVRLRRLRGRHRALPAHDRHGRRVSSRLTACWPPRWCRSGDAAAACGTSSRRRRRTGTRRRSPAWRTPPASAATATRGRNILALLDALAQRRYVSPYHRALGWTGLGDLDKAFALLACACEERDPALMLVATEPRFAALRRTRATRRRRTAGLRSGDVRSCVTETPATRGPEDTQMSLRLLGLLGRRPAAENAAGLPPHRAGHRARHHHRRARARLPAAGRTRARRALEGQPHDDRQRVSRSRNARPRARLRRTRDVRLGRA